MVGDLSRPGQGAPRDGAVGKGTPVSSGTRKAKRTQRNRRTPSTDGPRASQEHVTTVAKKQEGKHESTREGGGLPKQGVPENREKGSTGVRRKGGKPGRDTGHAATTGSRRRSKKGRRVRRNAARRRERRTARENVGDARGRRQKEKKR